MSTTDLDPKLVEVAQLRAGEECSLAPCPVALSVWCESDGAVLWWRFPVVEPPYVGTPLDDDWPGHHTHFTRLAVPVATVCERLRALKSPARCTCSAHADVHEPGCPFVERPT